MRNGGWFGGEFGMYGLLGRESGLMCGDCVVLNWGFGGGLVEGVVERENPRVRVIFYFYHIFLSSMDILMYLVYFYFVSFLI